MSIRQLQSVRFDDAQQEAAELPDETPQWWERVERLYNYLLEARAANFFEKVGLADILVQLEDRYEDLIAQDSSAPSTEEAAHEWADDAEALVAEAVRLHKEGAAQAEPELEYTPPPPQQPEFAGRLELAADWRWPWTAAGSKKKPRKKSEAATSSVTTRRVAVAGAVIGGGILIGRQFFGG